MKSFLKYVGIIVVILGAILIVVPAFMNATSNATLGTAGVLMVVGIIAHIFLNKYITE